MQNQEEQVAVAPAPEQKLFNNQKNMKLLIKMNAWLQNPKRDYNEGLAFFEKYASAEFKLKYSNFFALKKEGEVVDAFDGRFSVLINQITKLAMKVRLNPAAYPDVPDTDAQKAGTIGQFINLKKIITEKQGKIELLEDEIQKLQLEGDEKSDDIAALGGQIIVLQEEIKQDAQKSGLKVITYENLPKEMKKLYDRTKEIVPLMAKIHSELTIEDITDEKRKELAEELCKLDDERRAAWDKIDEWAKNGDSIFENTEVHLKFIDPFLRGMQVANRIVQLKENIQRNIKSAEDFKKKGKLEKEQKALERKAEFEQELAELQKEVDEKK